jgi:ABC-type antimicrobial peptide transport system permease subunit
LVTSVGSKYGAPIRYKNDSANVMMNLVDDNYIPLHQHKLLAGQNFNPRIADAEEREVIVNEQILKRFNIGDQKPEKAIGEVIVVDKLKLTIVGVVRDFHYGTMEDKIEPMLFRNSISNEYGYINAKIKTQNWPATFTAIESAWKKIDKIHPLQARFYDDQIEEAYSQFSVMIRVIGFLSFLAVCIASLGLFGMVVFTTETRLKEISIRKVLGASEGRLVMMLSKGFLFLLALSTIIALPATYFFFDKVVLAQFAYHQPIGIVELAISVAIVMVLAFIMIGSQTLSAARQHPAEVLKIE